MTPKTPRGSFRIADEAVAPGQTRAVNLRVSRLYTYTEVSMPLQIVHGLEDGPTLFICAALHGDEITGVEIIRRLLRTKAMKKIRGTLIAVPVVNVPGFIHQSRYLPDRRDLNRSFPGSSRGSLAAQLADLFLDQVVKRSTHGIDLHTGAIHRVNLPQVRALLNGPTVTKMAKAFGAPVILDSPYRDGSLRKAVSHLGIPIIVFETGEALRFDEIGIRIGVRGILNVMREIGMLKKSSKRRSVIRPFTARNSLWVRAPQSGILRAQAKVGRRVRAGDLLGVIADPFGKNDLKVKSPSAGIIIGAQNLPLVNRGDALFHIAAFSNIKTVENNIRKLQMEMDPDIIPLVNVED